MEVRIGVLHTGKELQLELSMDAAEVESAITNAASADGGILWLTDAKGRRIAVPADKVAYVEIDSEAGTRPVGFGM